MDIIEEKIITAFISPNRRDRYLSLLKNKKMRNKILHKLNHCHDLDERFLTSVPSNTKIYELLKSEGATDSCYVISDYMEIDGDQKWNRMA